MNHKRSAVLSVGWTNVYQSLAVYLSRFADHDVTCGVFSENGSRACTCGLDSGLKVLDYRLRKDSAPHSADERVQEWASFIARGKD